MTAKDLALEENHLLRYKFTKGEVIQWKVCQLGTTEATVQGNTQTTKMRAVSTKQWKVIDVDEQGNATFVHSCGGRRHVAEGFGSAGGPLQQCHRQDAARRNTYMSPKPSAFRLRPSRSRRPARCWNETKRRVQANSGLGDIAMPLPLEPVKVGQDWHLSNEVRVRRQDGKQLRVKTRIVYTLKSVKTGVATIAVKTEVITPVNDPQIKSQLVQQLTNGEMKFDMDAGRVLSQQIDWDETVVGFSGDDSVMKYLARFTEELLPAEKVAEKPSGRDVR